MTSLSDLQRLPENYEVSQLKKSTTVELQWLEYLWGNEKYVRDMGNVI